MIFPWWSETRKFKQKKTYSYQEFTDKFKPKRTTDDCYTPDFVFEAVKDYVFKKWNIAPNTPVVRPFWPGADFTACNYPAGCIVIDNPPFSLLSSILEFYIARSIRFFLFAPALTVLQHAEKGFGFVFVNNSITYANGANVRTAFIHNFDSKITCSGILDKAIKAPDKSLRKIKWPANWLAASDFMNKTRRLDETEEEFVENYVSLKKNSDGCQRFGGGVLVADADAERFAGIRNYESGIEVRLGKQELETVRRLNKARGMDRKDI